MIQSFIQWVFSTATGVHGPVLDAGDVVVATICRIAAPMEFIF